MNKLIGQLLFLVFIYLGGLAFSNFTSRKSIKPSSANHVNHNAIFHSVPGNNDEQKPIWYSSGYCAKNSIRNASVEEVSPLSIPIGFYPSDQD